MVRYTRLREALVTRRGRAAAAAAAAALALTASQAAAEAGPAWSKVWAEQRLRTHFDADSAVCLPIGRAVRGHAPASFKEFLCVVVMRDGMRYTIRLKPRNPTAWTTLSIVHHDAAPASGRQPARPQSPDAGKEPPAHN
jgi:hypothetical protein